MHSSQHGNTSTVTSTFNYTSSAAIETADKRLCFSSNCHVLTHPAVVALFRSFICFKASLPCTSCSCDSPCLIKMSNAETSSFYPLVAANEPHQAVCGLIPSRLEERGCPHGISWRRWRCMPVCAWTLGLTIVLLCTFEMAIMVRDLETGCFAFHAVSSVYCDLLALVGSS
jgi:hypothetical protein